MAEKLSLPSRDELVRRYERDYKLRNADPDVLVGENTAPGVDARVVADQLLAIYSEASRIADSVILENLLGTDLEEYASDHGVNPSTHLPAVGSVGSVFISAATGGATLPAGLECRHLPSGLRFKTLYAGTEVDGAQVAIGGVDTGPQTNLEAGSVLTWSSPPAGLGSTCTVVSQVDGNGLTGGRIEETDFEMQERIRSQLSNPAVAGNDADYQKAALNIQTVSVQAAFTYPCIIGPGTTGLAFTVRPNVAGGSRVPNAAQIAAVRSSIVGLMPKDDSLLVATVVADPVTLVVKVRWQRGVIAWADNVPWPVYDAASFTVQASPAPTTTSFAVGTAMASPPAPQVGQTIAIFDQVDNVFRQKRIANVSGSNPWTLTFDTNNQASDTSYTAVAGQRVSPWSDGLDAILSPVRDFFDGLGPGEQVSSPFDAGGTRQKRVPSPSQSYPYALTGRVMSPLYQLLQVDDIDLVEPSLPLSPAVGLPGTVSRILELYELAAYPL